MAAASAAAAPAVGPVYRRFAPRKCSCFVMDAESIIFDISLLCDYKFSTQDFTCIALLI